MTAKQSKSPLGDLGVSQRFRGKQGFRNLNNLKLFSNIWRFYDDGFRAMTVGRKLWVVILIKIFIIFFILKLFFFPNFLNSRFQSDAEKGDYVREQLIIRE